jgi:dolichol-phosphate mannosyltransferase
MISIILPTYKECENLKTLVPEIVKHSNGYLDEIFIVDDNSQDGTEEWFQAVKYQYPITLHTRFTERGLSSAILTGILNAKNDQCVIMDADHQHPPETIPSIVYQMAYHPLVVGSRYIKGGGTQGWTFKRKLISKVTSWLSRPLCGLKDGGSGFFGLDRRILAGKKLNLYGFKFGLEVFSKCKTNSVEVPYIFRSRTIGDSKFTFKQVLLFLRQLGSLYWEKFDLTRMMKFCIVGTLGLIINTTVLFILTDIGGIYYLLSNLFAVGSAMLCNFYLNKKWTFKQ